MVLVVTISSLLISAPAERFIQFLPKSINNNNRQNEGMSKECGETITIQVPNNFPSDSLVSVVGSDGLTYAVRLPKDAVPGSKITVLIPTRESVDSTNKSMQSNYTPSQITMGAAAAAGSEMLKLFYLFNA